MGFSVTKYLLIVSMDVQKDKEDLFNEVYDTEHIPAILKVTGVIKVKRYKLQSITMNFGGELKDLDIKTEPRYTAIYEIRNPDVLKSNEWGDAVEFGRWADEVRPFTSNRQFALRKLIE